MAIVKIQMWSAKCNRCDSQLEMYDGWIASNDKSHVREEVENNEDWCYILESGHVFCGNCHTKEWSEDETKLLAIGMEGKVLGVIE